MPGPARWCEWWATVPLPVACHNGIDQSVVLARWHHGSDRPSPACAMPERGGARGGIGEAGCRSSIEKTRPGDCGFRKLSVIDEHQLIAGHNRLLVRAGCGSTG